MAQRALPGGTVTLMQTDIEGSTRLLRALRDRYAAVLDDHRRILRAACDAAGGHEVDAHGDAYFAVFARARDAVAAAAHLQRELAAHDWPDGARVAVRTGIHTGEPLATGTAYVGIDVHRVARIMAAAHGGQVLLSSTTRALLDADELPRATIRDLGEHRLRGLAHPERVYQLVLDDLPDDFAPISALESTPPQTTMRVVVADDSVLLREGIASLLVSEGFEVVAQAGDADGALRAVAEQNPDVAIVDIRMPPTHTDEGLRVARTIRVRHRGVGVLLLSQYAEPDYAMALLGEGTDGVGYLLKDRVADVAEFSSAVRRVGEGRSALDPAVVAELVSRERRGGALGRLSAEGREVLALMAEGRSNPAIAARLGLSARAVEGRIATVLDQLGIEPAPDDHRRVLAVLLYLGARG